MDLDLTAAPGDELVLVADALNPLSTGARWSVPAGMTTRASKAGLLVSSAVADQTLPAAGASGTRTATIDNGAQLEAVLVALRRAPDVFYFGHDQAGSTRLLTDPTGDVAAAYAYDPYGVMVSHTGYAGTPLRYDGAYQDDESGYYYLQARYYDPVIAQFLTRDPLEALTGTPYSYAADSPLLFSDPSGLSCGHWYDAWACTVYHAVANHFTTGLKFAGIGLIIVGAAATTLESGGTSDLLAGTLIADLTESASTVAEISYAGSTADQFAQAATACKRNYRSADCLVSVAESLIGGAAGKVTEKNVARIVGKHLAEKIAGPAGHVVQGQRDVLFTELQSAKQCKVH